MSKIAIFDSGVGGLSVYQQIKQKLPDQNYLFCSDNAAYPYGTKSKQDLIDRVLLVIERLVTEYQPDILVIACNSASTVVLPGLRARFTLPIVGVVPAIKPAAVLSKTKQLALLATPATIHRAYTDQLVQQFAGDCEVHRFGSAQLVDLVEQKLQGEPIDINQLNECLSPLLSVSKLDVVILACTHFPLLNKEISEFFKVNNRSVKLVDSGVAIANRVEQLLPLGDSHNQHADQSTAVFTKREKMAGYFTDYLAQLGLCNIETME